MDRIAMAKWGSRIAAILMLLVFLFIMAAMENRLRTLKRTGGDEIEQDDGIRKSRKGKQKKDEEDELPAGSIW